MRKSEMRELVEQKVLLTGPIRPRGMADRARIAAILRDRREARFRAALSHARRRPGRVVAATCGNPPAKRTLPSDGVPTVPVRVMSSSAREQ